MNKLNINRRQIFGAATAAFAAQVGGSLLATSPWRETPLLTALRRALLLGDSAAFAATANAVGLVDAPIVEINMSAKLDANTLLFRPNAAGVGLVGNADYAASAAFPNLSLAKFFGDYLLPAQSTMSLALIPAAKGTGPNGGGGNHDYNAEIAQMTTTGSMAYALNKATGAMLNLDYSTQATANTGTPIFAAGGSQLVSYSSVAQSITAVSAAANPMKALPTKSAAAQTALNDLVTSDTKFAAQLAALGTTLQTAVTGLTATSTLVSAKPPTLATQDYFNTAAVQANNPLLLQLAVADVAWKAGLTRAVTMTLGSNDVNGGGNFLQAGGNNPDRPGVSAATAKAMLGQFLAQFNQMYPKGYVIVKGEGGRANNGGDLNVALCVIMGPAGAFPSSFLGEQAYADSAMFGANPALAMSDGTTTAPAQANVCATVAKLAGLSFGSYPYLTDLVKT